MPGKMTQPVLVSRTCLIVLAQQTVKKRGWLELEDRSNAMDQTMVTILHPFSTTVLNPIDEAGKWPYWFGAEHSKDDSF